jgi:uncharacterized membrane protein YidH (DUF202 family)
VKPHHLLYLISGAFGLVAVGIWGRQRRARSCRLHSPAAGAAAVILAFACLLVSLLLIVAAWQLGGAAPDD